MAAATTRTVKAKFDGDAKGLVAAAKEGERAVDRFGKDVEKRFKRDGERASKGFASSMRRWFGGEGGGLLKQIGQNSGTVFGSGLLGALKTPILGPALLATMTAAALTVMPAAGAVAGAGLVAGFGAGLAGLGLVFAGQSERVQAKWKATLAQLGADMRLLAAPFEDTMINVADIFERTVDRFNPHLAKAFAQLADPIEDFADDAGRALEGLIPAINPVTDAFEAVLDTLGPALSSAIDDVAAGMIDLAESVRENPNALADLVRGVGAVTRTGLDLVRTLNDVNGAFEDMTGGVSLVEVTLRGVQSVLAPLIGLFKGLEYGIGLVNEVKYAIEGGEPARGAAVASTEALSAAYRSQGQAAKGTIAPTLSSADALAEQKRQAAEAKARFEGLIDALFRTSQEALSLSGAAINVEAALDDAAQAAADNGRTLDIHTEKGRANQEQLNRVAEAANRQTETMIRQGKSNVTVARTAEATRANFIKLARQMGATVPEAKRMADQMIAIPNVTRTAKLQANKTDLERKVAAAKAELAQKDLTKERRAKLTADIANARAGIATINRMLNNLPASRTITLTTRQITTRQIINQTATGGGRAPGFASGGLPQPRRTYLVGERGPELLTMGGTGGRIHSNESLNAIGPNPAPMVAEIHIEIGGEVVRVVRTEIKADKRDTKRRVQAK